ncbi:hypothetical protein M911_05735 [Ectothiorhodospira haloalkaliphila]|uniref:Uncharacterized protein n=1 Tax=Ectothiorhodospira haloalkaliphila TaxID=421628 RepID=W8KLJ9_9GAMM|nr:hypothetical protein M911_05735 [Ectothiorhodospira haloalkaliphila]
MSDHILLLNTVMSMYFWYRKQVDNAIFADFEICQTRWASSPSQSDRLEHLLEIFEYHFLY